MKAERKYLRTWKNQNKYMGGEGAGAFYKIRDADHNKNQKFTGKEKKKQTPEKHESGFTFCYK